MDSEKLFGEKEMNKSVSSAAFLSVAGLGAPLSSSLLKRRYISLQNE